METLESNMYVRTKYGEIAKLKVSRFQNLIYETDIEIDRNNDRDCNDYGFDENTIKDIIKASHNIIDLIEVGDYVNGYLVTDVYRPTGDEVFRIEIERDTLKGHIIDDSTQIKTILTKEQFESNCYKIEK